MIRLITQPDAAYERFVSGHAQGHLFQSQLWAGVKKNWQSLALASAGPDGEIRGTIQLLVRHIPLTPWRVAYAPRGPVCDLRDRETLDELLRGAREAARRGGACTVKIDPNVPAADAVVLHTAMTNAGFCLLPERQDFGLIQPQYVVRLNISGKTEQALFAALKSKTRYNIRLAVRRGVQVRVCPPETALDAFCALMQETGARDGFTVRPKAYFENLLHALGDHARLYMAYAGETPLAGAIALQYGDKTWYAYGASSSRHRELMPNYLLQWEMIRWAVQSGCAVYDFRGVSGDMNPENPLYGLWRFKSGWNGQLTRFVGEYDCVLHPAGARLLAAALPVGRRLAAWKQAGGRFFAPRRKTVDAAR